ncbi:nucleotidyltransferase domain-containing protein [Candidatus Azambacteria bacterium]|nr:nucleotidyltransferase domain-containing protein [Candidatus Azambacteria bacterium]
MLFGSQVKGTSREGSDFDVAIYLKNNKSIFQDLGNYSKLLNELIKILNVENKKVDLTNLNTANILLRYEITSSGILLAGNEEEYLQYKAFAFRDYFDAGSLFNLEKLLIDKRQESLKDLIFSK